MKATLLVVVAISLFAACFATTDAEYQQAFTEWMHKNTKTYSSDEFLTRFFAFKKNHDFVGAWDAKEQGFEVALNQFADLSVEEYSAMYLGTRKTVNVQSERILPIKTKTNAPDSVDWRTQGYVTPIKNQGQCGSCWSFSTTGSTEGANFKKTGNLVSLSEQDLVDCSGSFGNQGCNGGLMDDAFKYIIKNGIVSEASYPYTASQGKCNLSGKQVVASLTSYKDIKSGSESDLTSELATVGPVSVAIDASHSSFQLYSSGVYYEKQCSSTQLDHGVLAVGYGSASGTDYYIVKNSWGTTWGMSGYINMSRNKNNNCGIATMASYPIA